MKEQIEKYLKWKKRKERILDLIERNDNERYYEHLLDFVNKYKNCSAFDFPGRCKELVFHQDTFDIKWEYKFNGPYADTERGIVSDIPYSFFDDPTSYFNERNSQREEAANKLKIQKTQDKRQEELALLAKLKAKYEPPNNSMGD